MKNRLQGILIGLIIGIALCSMVFAEQITETISVIFDDYRLYIDGKEAVYSEDSKPMNYNGRIYVPLRFVAENMGKDVSWEEQTKSVYITKAYSEKFLLLPLDSISNEELMRSAATISKRLSMIGFSDVQYSITNGKIEFSAIENTLTKETLQSVSGKGVLLMQDKDGNTILERADLSRAYVCNDDLVSGIKQPYVEIELTDSGREKFSDATSRISFYANNENYIKVFLDNSLISMPYVYQKIDAKKIIINGVFTEASAKNLAAVLNSEPLFSGFVIE